MRGAFLIQTEVFIKLLCIENLAQVFKKKSQLISVVRTRFKKPNHRKLGFKRQKIAWQRAITRLQNGILFFYGCKLRWIFRYLPPDDSKLCCKTVRSRGMGMMYGYFWRKGPKMCTCLKIDFIPWRIRKDSSCGRKGWETSPCIIVEICTSPPPTPALVLTGGRIHDRQELYY